VQALPSSHGVPSSVGGFEHVPWLSGRITIVCPPITTPWPLFPMTTG